MRKRKTRIGAGLLLAALLAFLAGCGSKPEEKVPEKTVLSLLTGGMGSPYASLGQDVAERVNAVSHTLALIPELSAGPEANLRLLASGRCLLAIVSADLVHYAGEGSEMFARAPAEGDVVVLARLGLEPLYFLGGPGIPIKDAAALKGKSVSLGQGSSRTQALALSLLQSFHFDPAAAYPTYLGEGQVLPLLASGELDAAFYLAAVPGETELRQHRIIPYTPRQEEAWLQALPFAVPLPVPAETFLEQKSDIRVPAIPLYLAASRELDPKIRAELITALQKTAYPVILVEPGSPYPGDWE